MKLIIIIIASVILFTATLSIQPTSVNSAEQTSKPVITKSSSLKANPSVSEDIPTLVKEMGNKEYNIRSHALETICKIGEPAIPSLMEGLTDTNSYVRKGSVEALGRIGIVRPEIVSILIKALIDRDSYVRRSAAEALGKIGKPAVPSIIEALKDNDSFVRKGAADALGNIGSVTPQVIPSLIDALEDEDNNVRKSAADALGKISPSSPEVIPALKKIVEDKDSNVRNSAVEALEMKGAMTTELKVKRYILDLNDSNSDVRKRAVDTLYRIGPITPEVIPAITATLGDSDYSVRKSSAEFLEKNKAMTDALKAKRSVMDLKYGNNAVRMRAAQILGKLGAVTPEVVPSLIDALGGDKDVQDAAIEALGKIGPAAKDAAPSLSKILTDIDSTARTEAAEALGKIGPAAKGAVPSLVIALKDSDPAARSSAAEALKKIGAMTLSHKLSYFYSAHPFITAFSWIGIFIALIFASAYAVPFFWKLFFPVSWYVRRLRNPDTKKRTSAAQALTKIGKSAIPALINALKQKNSDIRINASEALNNIGKIPPKAIPLLLRSLRDKESEVRKNITEVFGKTGPESTDVVPALIRALGDSDNLVRASAAEALGKCGSATPEVIPALMKALGDSYYNVRDSAAAALEKCSAMHVSLKVKRCITDFGDSHTNILSRAVEELDNIGPEAVPELIKALGDPNSHIRRFAAAALEKRNALSTELKVKRYILDLGDSHTSVRTRAAEALGNIGEAAAEAIPHIIKLVGNHDYYVRWHATDALEKLGALTTEIKVKRFILDLGDSNADVRGKAADALSLLPADSKEALPKLKKLLEDEDEIVRKSAEKAIGLIEAATGGDS